jgi:hypothetical protein
MPRSTPRSQFRPRSKGLIGGDQPLTLKLPRILDSPNTWNGRHWRVKHRLSQDWEKQIGGALADLFVAKHGGIDFPNALIGQCLYDERRVRVTVQRHVPSARNFIRDDDNLRFAVKPLLDALKRQGYIKNDSRNWIEHDTPTQHVSADGKPWTIVRLEPLGRREA